MRSHSHFHELDTYERSDYISTVQTFLESLIEPEYYRRLASIEGQVWLIAQILLNAKEIMLFVGGSYGKEFSQ